MNKNKTKISILVVNYNNADYLDECLQSLLKQTYENKEIILLDDNSTDNSLDLLNKYENKIKIVKKKMPKKNIPSYDQFESYIECLKVSKGDIIFLCDSDDYFLDNKIEKIVNKFDNNENCKIIFDLPIINFKNKFKKKKIKKKIISTFWPYIPPTSCISIRKNFFYEISKQLNFTNFQDLWLDFRLGISSYYKFNKLEYFNENLTIYRQTHTNISSKFKFNSINWWKRRLQAHEYLRLYFQTANLKYSKNIDYYLTKLINIFLK